MIDPSVTERVDWEVELALVIARSMKRVSEAEALDCVRVYTVANDVSARDRRRRRTVGARQEPRYLRPNRPVRCDAGRDPDPRDLVLRTRVNGELVQNSSTREVVFGVAELLAYCSRSFTLDLGDVLLTGAPWGCGGFMDPPRCLQPGDWLETEMPPIGALTNPIVAPDIARPI